MPTQEERLETLENDLKQFKTETVKAYGEMAVEMTIVKRLASLKDQIEHRFGRIDTHLDGMDVHLESMDGRFERVDTRLDGIDANLKSIDGRFERVDTRLDGMDGRLSRLENLLMQVLARLPEQ